MKLRHIAVLALFSILAFVALTICGALWFIATVNGLFLFLPWWLSHLRGLPWNPVGILATFNSMLMVVSMVPWAILCVWTVWKVEGAWLDLIDPNGAPQ
jgi:hypothetical protein